MTNKLGIIKFSPNKKIGFIFIEMECQLDGGACKECGEASGKNISLPEKWNDPILEGWIVYVDNQGVLQIMDEDPHDYR